MSSAVARKRCLFRKLRKYSQRKKQDMIRQESIPMEKRHPALQWMYAYIDELNSKKPRRIGAGAAWIRLAYDIHTISDNATLEAKLKERLLKYKSFQTARHELWTAALFIAAGFEINFVDETDSTKKHPEFIALDKESGIEIAVEAKCRQRKNVLGFADGSDKPLGEDVGITSLLKRRIRKRTVYRYVLSLIPTFHRKPKTGTWGTGKPKLVSLSII